MNEFVVFEGEYASAINAKNILFRKTANKKENEFVIVIADTNTQFTDKELFIALEMNPNHYRKAEEEYLGTVFATIKGAMSVFALANCKG